MHSETENLDIVAIIMTPFFMIVGGWVGYQLYGDIGCVMMMASYPAMLMQTVARDIYRYNQSLGHTDIGTSIYIGAIPTSVFTFIGYMTLDYLGAVAGAVVGPLVFVGMSAAEYVIYRRVNPSRAVPKSLQR